MSPKMPSEEILGRKWDRCLADTTIKTGGGLAIGLITSLIFFKRKSWPVVLGTGVGLGMGYANCKHTFQSREAPPCPGQFRGPPHWKMDPERKEKWKKHWEEKWKSFGPKEVVDVVELPGAKKEDLPPPIAGFNTENMPLTFKKEEVTME